MSDIQSLIKLLQDKKSDRRYDACEQLRVSPSLPPEALEALRLVTDDPNPDVADAAQRVLALHTQMDNEKEVVNEKDKAITNTPLNLPWPLIGLLVGLVTTYGYSAIEGQIDRYSINCFPFFFPFSVLGAFLGRRRIGTAIIGAVLGGCFGIGLLELFEDVLIDVFN